MAMEFPLINGFKCSWVEIGIAIFAAPLEDFISINYDDDLTGEMVRAEGVYAKGRTRGQAVFTGSMELLKDTAHILFNRLKFKGSSSGLSYREVPFDMFIKYRVEGGASITVDSLVGTRLGKISDGHSVGTGGLTQKIDLSIMNILRNGLPISGISGSIDI